MKYDTTRWGRIEVKPEEIITFPDGPLGFPDCTRFAFVDEYRMAPFRCLQSLDNLALAFVVVSPNKVRKEYKIEIGSEDLKMLEAKSIEDLSAYCVVTMAPMVEDVSLNLMGPFIINESKKIAYQIITTNGEYTTREKMEI